MQKKAHISVIIPVYKDLLGLKKTAKSIYEQSFKDYEIIVINDGADPVIQKYCESQKIRSTNISPNKGSYNARNVGIEMAEGDFIAFTDADLQAEEDWLKKGLEYLQTYDYVAGNVLVQEELIVDIATFHDYLTAFPIKGYFNNLHFGVTANLFVKKKIFGMVGLFDAALKSGGDLEFGDRVFRNHISQIYADNCIVKHPPRSHQEKKIKSKRVRKGQIILLEKYPDRFGFLRNKTGFVGILKEIAPPRWSSALKIYKKGYPYSLWSLYQYMYLIKLLNFRTSHF